MQNLKLSTVDHNSGEIQSFGPGPSLSDSPEAVKSVAGAAWERAGVLQCVHGSLPHGPA